MSEQKRCHHCGTHFRKILDMQIRIEQLEDTQRNLLEKIEQLEDFQIYEGLDEEFLEILEG